MGATTDGAVEVAKANKKAGEMDWLSFRIQRFATSHWIQESYSFHKAIADETDLPIVLFQLAPVFGGVLYTRETLIRLLEIQQVVAIKEASFDAQYFSFTKDTLDMAGRSITLLTGNDRFITESFLLGAEGALLGFAAIGCKWQRAVDHFAKGEYREGVAMRSRSGLCQFYLYGSNVGLPGPV
jgi:4-hydroxy-tetrahydrodipicolinate synthase